ncbi:hypothetical protein D1B33_05685 [Lysinibacillus yapensis]|uniref:Peptidase A2 domain-containing protein n=1 Tax=Ureibacillus yapensis TaxID=2304605 RepID=A0A396SB96_9BACL|nr:retropepsin-like aspartic protease [Lysinibacillus yapensis]RHW38373.1 hypothetical protein D1B33_05685 [Lysinibacillus yapensis]
MKKLVIDEGLLLTDMEICYKGNNLHLNRVLIDTGSMSTVVAAVKAEKIGIMPEDKDIIYRISGVGGTELVYSKLIDYIKMESIKVENFSIEISAMDYGFELDAIIGLNLLQCMKAKINIDKLLLQWHQ